MKFFSIVLLCIASAVAYGILDDQITARICVEYFTIGHPPMFETDNPTLLGLGWGVIATWWVGLILGVPLAMVSRVGKWPKWTAADVARPLWIMLLVVGLVAFLAGMVGHMLASRHEVWLTGWLAENVPSGRHVAFLTDLWAHNASYLGGLIGSVVLGGWILVRRASWHVGSAT